MTVSNVLYHFLPIWPRGNGRGTRKRVIPATAWPIFPFFLVLLYRFPFFFLFFPFFFCATWGDQWPTRVGRSTLVGNFRFIQPQASQRFDRGKHSFPLRREGKQANRNRSVASSYPCKQKPCPLLMRYAPNKAPPLDYFNPPATDLISFFCVGLESRPIQVISGKL